MNTNKNHLRKKAEELILKDQETSKDIPSENIKALLDELQARQIELDIQNDEFCKAQLCLIDMCSKYSLFI